MHRTVTAFALALALLLSPAIAEARKDLTPQQQRMADCAAKAKGLKGEEYKKTRNECLAEGKTEKEKEKEQDGRKSAGGKSADKSR